jgi:hypothetical protein
MGEMLWIDLSDAQIEALSVPRWVKTLYHNLHDYGWTIEDNGPPGTGSSNAQHLQLVSDYSWTAMGQPSQWTLMLNEMTAEGTNPVLATEAGAGNYYAMQIPTAAGVTPSNLHWLQYNANRSAAQARASSRSRVKV